MGFGLVSAATGRNGRSLAVDLDLTYGSAKLGRRIAPDLYVTGGVRRLALNYEITPGRRANPVTQARCLGPHRRDRLASGGPEAGMARHVRRGRIRCGADVDLGASFSLDWKPIPTLRSHRRLQLSALEGGDSVANRDVTLKLTAHGPTVGFGVYFYHSTRRRRTAPPASFFFSPPPPPPPPPKKSFYLSRGLAEAEGGIWRCRGSHD